MLRIYLWKNQKTERIESLADAFPFLHECNHVVSFVGAGGKTTLLYNFAEYSRKFWKTAVMTTTHMMKPLDGSYVENLEEAKLHWQEKQLVVVGTEDGNGKIKLPPEKLMDEIFSCAENVYIEADGAKHMPLKIPAEGEPVLIPESDIVIAVAGVDSLTTTFNQSCFREELSKSLLGKEADSLIKEEDIAKILTSESGGRKDVQSREYYIVLNKCDTKEQLKKAERTAEEIDKYGKFNIIFTSMQQ